MLSALHIKNIVLIETLFIEPQGGLCALTGETGAGKSILLDSIGLAMGMRSESRLVRKGADHGQVIAEFQIPQTHPAWSILKAADIETNGSEMILRRVVDNTGKSRAYINDQAVSVGLLKQVSEALIEIHGQFATQGLLNPANHRDMLDDYADLKTDLPEKWAAWKQAQEALEKMQNDAENLKEEEAFLRQSLEDLDALNPEGNEEETLKASRDRLMNREKILESLHEAQSILTSDNDPLHQALGVLGRVGDKIGKTGEALMRSLDGAASEIQESLNQINIMISDAQGEDHNLESIDDRLFALRAQARKHGCSVDALAQKRAELAAQLNLIEHGDDVLAQKMREVEERKQAYTDKAKQVSEKRQKSAEKLSKLVQKELPPLKMDKAKFTASIEILNEPDWGPNGMDQVRFLVATNPGSDPGPINKIASGGELARFMLALKVVMAETGSAGTLIFDEVDSGVGGAVADAVGERLAKLAETRQIMVVTHAPQIAARADHHWIVSKGGATEVTTNVIHLDAPDKRREEIARMLSGATITDEARAAANKLMETGT